MIKVWSFLALEHILLKVCVAKRGLQKASALFHVWSSVCKKHAKSMDTVSCVVFSHCVSYR